jgi:hypothetical protein
MQNREGQFLFSALREASRSSRDQPAKMKLGQIKPPTKTSTTRTGLSSPINLPGIQETT